MASDKAFVENFLAGLPETRVYPMMGDYVLYCREKAVGCICDNRVFLKITPVSERLLVGAPKEVPYAGAKPRLVVENVADKDFIRELLFAVADGLPTPKKKK